MPHSKEGRDTDLIFSCAFETFLGGVEIVLLGQDATRIISTNSIVTKPKQINSIRSPV